jgi:hypothetical protein
MATPEALIEQLLQMARGVQPAQMNVTPQLADRVNSLLNDSRDAPTRIVELLRPRASFDEHAGGTGATAVWEFFTTLFIEAGRQPGGFDHLEQGFYR